MRSAAVSVGIRPRGKPTKRYGVADEMRIGRMIWDEIDKRTITGRSELGYLAVVTSVLLPSKPPGPAGPLNRLELVKIRGSRGP